MKMFYRLEASWNISSNSLQNIPSYDQPKQNEKPILSLTKHEN